MIIEERTELEKEKPRLAYVIRKRTTWAYGLERLELTSTSCKLLIVFRLFQPRSLRKEVIQPQVLLRLPCYDFTPIMNHTLGLFD